MSFFQRVVSAPRAIIGASAAAETAAAAAPVTATPSTVFVELGAASQQANISRNGAAVPIVALDPAAVSSLIGATTPVVAKVVSQSIQPGVSVAKGTTIDLVLAEPARIHVSVLQNGFVPLAAQSLADVYRNIVRDSPTVQSVLVRNQSAAALSTQDTATLTTALSAAGAPVGTDPGHTIDAALHTLQAAYTFGG
jgi:hypothetical protein